VTTLSELNGIEVGLIAMNLFVLIVIALYPFFIRKYLRESGHAGTGKANNAVVLAWLWVFFIIVSNLELLGARLMTADRTLMSPISLWMMGHLFMFVVFMDRIRRLGRLSFRIPQLGLSIAVIGTLLFILAFFGYVKVLLALTMLFMLIALVFSIPTLWPPKHQKSSTRKSS
jgi:hypothetical protein